MAKLLAALGILLVANIIGSSASKLPSNVTVEVLTSEELKDILKQYPNAIELLRRIRAQTASEETREAAVVSPHVLMEYFLGVRVAGDFLVGHDAQSHTWGAPQDVEMTLAYPSSGVGYIVSYVNILARQSSNAGRAYIVTGGIGQRHIRVVVEAYQTFIFNHEANFYGY